jgi:amino acid transporter
MATAVVIGTVIGSGIFKKPQEVADSVPYFGMAALAWTLGGALVLLGSLAYAEVCVLYPRAGGNYVFLREGYGRLAGFLFGWVDFCIIRGASLAALATVFSESLGDILKARGVSIGFWDTQVLTVGVILGLALVNVRGVRWGGGLQLVITTVKIGSLLGIAALPFVMAALAEPPAGPPLVRAANLSPLWPAWDQIDLTRFVSALLAVLWAYHGWMNIAPVAEEVRVPQRNLPLALLAGTITIVCLYLGANLAYALVIPQGEMRDLTETTVATDFSRRLLGPVGATVASAAVMCSVFGALNGNLLVGPRLLYAMGEDGLAPRALGAVQPRYHTPALAILVLAGWAVLLVLAGALLVAYRLPTLQLGRLVLDLNVPPEKKLFSVMTDFAMFGVVIFETLALSTIFVFRWRDPRAERPYRCPGYPVVPALYVVVLAGVAVNMFVAQRTEALAGVAFIAVGALVYAAIRWRTPVLAARIGQKLGK